MRAMVSRWDFSSVSMSLLLLRASAMRAFSCCSSAASATLVVAPAELTCTFRRYASASAAAATLARNFT